MITERDIKNKIIQKLRKLNWQIDISKQKNVYMQTAKTEEERMKLGGLKPDFILYRSDTEEAIAIIEAKRPDKNLKNALEQAEKYAKKLNVNIILAYDGFKLFSKHLLNNKELVFGGTTISDFLSEEDLIKFIDKNKIDLNFGKIINNENDFINEMKKIEKQLRRTGLKAGDERFTEFAKILFLKLISHKENYHNVWNNILNTQSENKLTILNDQLKKLNKEFNMDKYGEELKITDINIVKDVINRLDKINFINTSLDVKGSAFEFFLNYKGKFDDLAQYFTPRKIVRFIVNLINPQPREKVYDPFCGSGGFLIKAFEYMKNQIIDNDNSRELMYLKSNSIFGTDISTIAYVAKMNMILIGDGNTNITRQIKGSLVNKRTGKYDIVMTNIPFSLPINSQVEGKMYEKSSSSGNSISVLHALDSLKKKNGSRAAIIVPELFIFNKNEKEIEIREYIIKNYNVKVFSLPQGVFLPYTIAKSCILYLEWKGQKGNFEFYNIDYVGFIPNNSKKLIDEDNLLDYIMDNNSLKKYTLSFEELNKQKFEFKPKSNNDEGLVLSGIFEESKHNIILENNKNYFEITVKINGLGAQKRVYNKEYNKVTKKGSEIKSKRYVISDKEKFVYSTLDARNGGFAKINEKLIGGVYSNTYVCFSIKKDFKEIELLLLQKLLSTTKMKKLFLSLSDGTTNRRSVKKSIFLNTKLGITKKELFNKNKKFKKELLKNRILEEKLFQSNKKLEDITNDLK